MKNYWFNTLKTPDSLPSKVDVIIIGGGISGLATLYHLLQYGVKNICLVEEFDIGYHASGRGCGQLMLSGSRMFHEINNSKYLISVYENNKYFLKFLEQFDFDIELEKSGSIRLASNDNELDLLIKERDYISQYVKVECPILSKEDINNLLSSQNDFVGGIFTPTDASFNPYKLIHHFSRKNVFSNCQVEKIKSVGEEFEISIRRKGIVKAKKVIYCVNNYIKDFFPNLQVKSINASFCATAPLANQVFPFNVVYDKCYIRSYNNRIITGIIGHKNKLRKSLCRVLPKCKNTKFTHYWNTTICETSDGLPLIGEIEKNQFIFSGLNQYGYNHVMNGSMIISDFIKKGSSSRLGVDIFCPRRFNV